MSDGVITSTGLGTQKGISMTATIYLIRCNGEPKYVGFTIGTIKKRWSEHRCAAKRNSQYVLHKAIRKYGENSFTIEEIYHHEDIVHTLQIMEHKLIMKYNTNYLIGNGYNMTLGGEGSIGLVTSTETRQLQSKIAKQRFQNPKERKRTSESTKRAMNDPCVKAKLLGRIVKVETKNKLRNHSLKNSVFFSERNTRMNIEYTILKEDGTIETIVDLKNVLGLTNKQFNVLRVWSKEQNSRDFSGKIKQARVHRKHKVKILKIHDHFKNKISKY